MIVVKKKTIIIVCVVMLTTIFMYLKIGGVLSTNSGALKLASSLVEGKVIVIDAGHR
ncbi:MAG: hypothetical protein FWC79_06660 [Oscillospiraceae bacterium]|nr:hypothetical protein [Oscillospiraceae bacterium]